MRWVFKWAAQKTISFLPNSHEWNYLFQKHLTGGVAPNAERIATHLEMCARHLSYYAQFAGTDGLPTRVLELGTGWVPTVCLALALSGVDTVFTVDIVDLKKPEVMAATLAALCSFSPDAIARYLPQLQPQRFERLKAMAAAQMEPLAIFAQFGIHFVIGDARELTFDGGPIDFFISNNTLEHIPADVILGILRQFRQLAAPHALMSHRIDASDHYSHFDPAISRYHFLQHGAALWKLVNNGVLYQNRLRASDYRRLHRQAGFVPVSEASETDDRARLDRLRLVREFQGYSRDDLAIITSWIVSRPV